MFITKRLIHKVNSTFITLFSLKYIIQMPMNAHYHDFLCEWRCYFGQQVAPKDTIIFIAQRIRDVTENLQNVYDTQKKR